MLGRSGRQALRQQQAGAGGPARGPPYLPAVGRDRGRGRRGPEGVVHGAAAASQVRPAVGGRGGGGWIREAGHCGARRESEAQAFRRTAATAGTLPFQPPSLPPNSQESKWAAKRGGGVAWGRSPRVIAEGRGWLTRWSPSPGERGKGQTSTTNSYQQD